MTVSLSVLDLAPVSSDSTGPQALRNSIELAQLADRLGYTRYWLAEHHNIPGIAISTPEIMISVIARETNRIRVGSGGVMLPNHAPLKVAEAFRTLEALYPGRIDLGIGRAPGTDQLTAYALRQSQERLQIDDFPEQLAELVAFGNGQFPDDHPFRRISAMPRDVTLPPIWLLGSSGGYSAQLAATLGGGYAFAYHINPNLNDAIAAFRTYRTHVQAGAQPHTMLALAVLCAENAERAEELATIMDLSFLRRQRGQLATLPTLEEAKAYPFTDLERAQARSHRDRQVVGDPATVRARLEALVQQTGADEVMVLTMISSHADRLRSYELLAEAVEL
ncbi:MAG: LLM class flavin-dependent oxidoreductase [Caldilineaceae bacterium]